MKKLLMTGASGFIGSYFIEYYGDQYDIQTFSFLKDDFNAVDCNGVEIILHLSALVHQMEGASEAEYERVNVNQSLQLAQKAKAAGAKHFIFMSTVKVYGEESETPYKETTPCHPLDAYGKSKLRAEQELQTLEDEHFKLSIIRTPIVYGKGVKANIKSLVNLVQKVPILPFGAISNRRSMVYIGNLCHLIEALIKQRQRGIFLASDDKPLSTTGLIKLIANNLNKKVHLMTIPLFETLLKTIKPSFHKRLYESLEVDNKLTKEQLSLKNPYTTEDGIKKMLE